MQPRPPDGLRRRALCIGVGAFGRTSVNEEGPPTGPGNLPFAAERTAELAAALDRLGYESTVLDGDLPAADLGTAVEEAILGGDRDDILVVHVLSHGLISETGALQVVGADGEHHPRTVVESWLRSVVDHSDSAPITLFLLDICYAGAATRHSWQVSKLAATNRAWVIAASEPTEQAFGGRFTKAITKVLTDLSSGALDLDSSVEHAPITTIAQRVRREVTLMADRPDGLSQQVTASLVDISHQLPRLPFFPNVQYVRNVRRTVRRRVDAAVTPFLDDLDEALDPAHFVGRAAGVDETAEEFEGFFSGRSRELKILAPWVNLQDEVGLRVLTGSPGAGKSALLGVLVCAAHPLLHEPTRPVWDHVEQAPYRNPLMAAVHARQRDLGEVTGSVARQLGIVPSAASSPAALVDAVAALPGVPVIVIDALDEAIDGESIMTDLVLPLSRVVRADGEPVRLLVGMRPWREFEELRRAAGDGLLDLDDVPATRLRRDVQQYVSRLLLHDRRWDRLDVEGYAHTLARAVAESLTDGSADRHWGAFLVAGLFTHHILNSYPEPPSDMEQARLLGASTPRTLPELLELDLRTRTGNPLLRPVLKALAHAHGDGMPAEVLRHAAAAFHHGEAPESPEILRALDELRFYLRHSVETDGTSRYRLFHQGLADHLHRAEDAEPVFRNLLRSVPRSRYRHWEIAEPYLLRHSVDHAEDADRIDLLLSDAGFLIEAEPAVVSSAAQSAGADARRLAAAYLGLLPEKADRQSRLLTLAFAALRIGATSVSAELAAMPADFTGSWVPLWMISGDDAGSHITAMAMSETALIVGRADGRVEVLRLTDGTRQHFLPPLAVTHVRSVAAGTVRGQAAVAAATANGLVGVWSAETGNRLGGVIPTGVRLRGLSIADLGGRPAVLVIDDAGQASLWGIESSTRLAVLAPETRDVQAIAGGDGLLERFELGADRTPTVRIDGEQVDVTMDGTEPVAAAVGAAGSQPYLYAAGRDGSVGAWSPGPRDYVDVIKLPHRVHLLTAGAEGQVAAAGDEFLYVLRYLPATGDDLPSAEPLVFAAAAFVHPAPPPVVVVSPPPIQQTPAHGEEEVSRRTTGTTVAIDLGASRSVISTVIDGKPRIIPTAEGARSTPSVVAFAPDGRALVGEPAMAQAAKRPHLNFASLLRQRGGLQKWDIDGMSVTAQQVIAQLLTKLRQDAEHYLQEPITDAVITVPSCSSNEQRRTIREAAEIAGLGQPWLINDSSAAALAHGAEQFTSGRTVMIFHLGASSLSVSVVETSDASVRVLSAAGDARLGAEEWTRLIATRLITDFKRQHNIDLRRNREAMRRLLEASEKAKIVLSEDLKVDVHLPAITTGPDGPVDIATTLNRAEFQLWAQHLLEQCLTAVRSALAGARIEVSDIDDLVFVGGGSRIPAVSIAVQGMVRKRAHWSGTEELVATGAALRAGAMAGKIRSPGLQDVTTLSLGVVTSGNVTTLIDRNVPLPARYTVTFTTRADSQRTVQLPLVQGQRGENDRNESLGVLELTGFGTAPAGTPQIEVTFEIDESGMGRVAGSRERTIGSSLPWRIIDGPALDRTALVDDAETTQELPTAKPVS